VAVSALLLLTQATEPVAQTWTAAPALSGGGTLTAGVLPSAAQGVSFGGGGALSATAAPSPVRAAWWRG
jgi:hypothetical protein